MRSHSSFPLGIAPSLFAQAATSVAGPSVLKVTVTLVLVPQSKVCNGVYKPGDSRDSNCSVPAQKAESLKATYKTSGPHTLSAGKSVALPLEPKFHNALTPCIDEGVYAVLLEFNWEKPLLVVAYMVRDGIESLPELSSSHGQSNRNQASPYSPRALIRSDPGRTMRASPQASWCTHRSAIDFDPDPDDNVKWKLILNDTWYGFFVKPAP